MVQTMKAYFLSLNRSIKLSPKDCQTPLGSKRPKSQRYRLRWTLYGACVFQLRTSRHSLTVKRPSGYSFHRYWALEVCKDIVHVWMDELNDIEFELSGPRHSDIPGNCRIGELTKLETTRMNLPQWAFLCESIDTLLTVLSWSLSALDGRLRTWAKRRTISGYGLKTYRGSA